MVEEVIVVPVCRIPAIIVHGLQDLLVVITCRWVETTIVQESKSTVIEPLIAVFGNGCGYKDGEGGGQDELYIGN
ncbi:unnamed protein product [Penicillium discolor]